ncbi:hypothetical protein LJC24_04620, partial [Desulfococcaceae bacterium OttesenSCG-928-F15]|nr:hypothetical protein [Desulfococcaceae bacterium OttesenSCG-928-F15]
YKPGKDFFMRYFIMFSFILLSACTYTLDGLKPETISESNPAECPEMEGSFAGMGKERRSSGEKITDADLALILFGMGLLHQDRALPSSSKSTQESKPDEINADEERYWEVYRFIMGTERDRTRPVHMKLTADGMEIHLEDNLGSKRKFRISFGEQEVRGCFWETARLYCSQEKLLIRHFNFHSNYGESFEKTYTDAVLRFDEEGLTVTMHRKRDWKGGFMFIPLSSTRTGDAVFFFPVVRDSTAIP